MNCAIQFKKNLIQFFDELIDQFPSETDLIFARVFLTTVNPDTIITNFIQKVGPFKDIIMSRDEQFFLENNLDFMGDGLNKSKVNHFKCIWKSNQLDDEDREIIWKWFETFILISEKYTGKKE